YFDGFSLIGGHEYAEAVTDPFPNSGWLDAGSNEIADKCQWTSGTGNVSMGSQYFAMQPLWSNRAADCVMTAQPVTTPTPAPTPTPTPTPVPPPAGSAFHPLLPQRILDTRSSEPLGPGQSLPVAVAGQFNVPTGATAAAINVGVTGSHGAGSSYIVLFPSGTGRPNASTANFVAGQTSASMTTVALGADGGIVVYNSQGWVDVFLDLSGYFAPATSYAGSYHPLAAPARLLDTRTTTGGHPGPLGSGESYTLPVAGQNGIPSSATAVVVNLTEVGGTEPSYLAAWPAGGTWPGISNLNFPSGRVLANRAMVGLGAGGIQVINSQGSADVLVDVAGWFSSDPGVMYTAQPPLRVFDTRTGLGGHVGPLGPGERVTVALGPASCAAAGLEATVLNSSTYSYLGVYPSPAVLANTSDINFQPGDILPNLSLASTAAGCQVTIYNSAGSVDVFLDLQGTYA
ncbi:MAG TPA: hypothetical protein VF134_04855, partial [Candidatus Dormibacteraeota bacterium]